ncbi:MAG: hypothetical protein H9535_15695 [Ignavibacteria bacterium]|nr:hypothetical protein [Ignavibacteria bacterium]MBL7992618.1 hypothetical protein [Candidatus Kapabacteria bacterium]
MIESAYVPSATEQPHTPTFFVTDNSASGNDIFLTASLFSKKNVDSYFKSP